MRLVDDQGAQITRLGRAAEGISQTSARGLGRRETEALGAVGDTLGDDAVLDVIAPLEGERLGEAANVDRLLLVVDPKRYGWNDDERDAAPLSLLRADEAYT